MLNQEALWSLAFPEDLDMKCGQGTLLDRECGYVRRTNHGYGLCLSCTILLNFQNTIMSLRAFGEIVRFVLKWKVWPGIADVDMRQAEGGTPVADVCRQLGVSEASFYLWKKKYGKLGMTEIREMRQLRDENARLKRLVAELTLDKHILGEVVRKKL